MGDGERVGSWRDRFCTANERENPRSQEIRALIFGTSAGSRVSLSFEAPI